MSLRDRLAALSPEQRVLLERSLKEKGIDAPLPSGKQAAEPAYAPKKRRAGKGMDFSIFFFSGDGSTDEEDKYRLLTECAALADARGFQAIWTPERHFEEFGGLYPNPSVLGAALAMITKHVQIRAGSVALPLHHPIRFVEEWSVVDNLSGGRAAVSFASGWHPADFLLAPVQSPAYYDGRKQAMFEAIHTVKRLWAGETVPFADARGNVHGIRTLPRPIQPELEIWVTTTGSEETYRMAGEIGANILTGVNTNYPEFESKIAFYRETLARHGFDPDAKKVTTMLHTFLGDSDEAVKAQVKEPMKRYLKTYLNQQKNVYYEDSAQTDADHDRIVERAFEHYFQTGTLLGSREKCARLIETLIDVGVDEVACLVDFGLDFDAVLGGFGHLTELKNQFQNRRTTV